MRRLHPGERSAIESFLCARVETSLFPLGNLDRHGMAGGHPRAMTFWGAGDPLEGVLGLTDEGAVLPQIPPGLAHRAVAALGGRRITGILGEAAQVRALREAAGLTAVPAQLDREEPLFALDLSHLHRPDPGALRLVRPEAVPRDLLVRWRSDYGREALGWGWNADAQAEADVARGLAEGNQRVLLREDGEPVAITGFNARVGEVAQVGGGWTPPEHRSRGYARTAMALHLAEARAEGLRRVVLFSASEPAMRAYRALGFREIGLFQLLIFAGPREVRPA